MEELEVARRLSSLGLGSLRDVADVLHHLRGTESVRDGKGIYERARIVGLMREMLHPALQLLERLSKATPAYHPGYRWLIGIPSRCFDTTHSSVPRPVDSARNDAFYCANPHKRGFLWKVPVVARTWDGAVLHIGKPVPGRVADVTVPPPETTLPHLADLGYVGAKFNAVCGKKRPRGGELMGDEKRYSACMSRWRCVAECVHGRLKVQYKRLRFWAGRDDGTVLRSAWAIAACAHNVHIARHPLVRPGAKWDWVLTGTLPSSDPWPGGIPQMLGSGGDFGPPPLPRDL